MVRTTTFRMVLACLASACFAELHAQEWRFNSQEKKAYEHVLNLYLDEAHALLPYPGSAQSHYITSLAEALELVFNEDSEKFTLYEERFEKRLDRKSKTNDPDELFLKAELHLQWAFVYLKFGYEFDAARNIRQAYLFTQEVKKSYPDYKAIKKTSAVLNIIIGSIPEKYNWVLSLLSMRGSVKAGLEELNALRNADHPLNFESHLLYGFIQGFVLQQPEHGIAELATLFTYSPYNKLVLFLGASLHIKNANSEEALNMLTLLTEQPSGSPLPFANYLKGEVFLHKAEYPASIEGYQSFIQMYAGQNHIKDAYYKIGLCSWLNGNPTEAQIYFKKAKAAGKEATEADKYAARSMAEKQPPHIALTKARYYTDGGYYEEAKKILDELRKEDLPTKRDQVEHPYRRARIAHKTMDYKTAKRFYVQTIDVNESGEWYFAPNACLQLGYIAAMENDTKTASYYFKKALSYKKHVYKNSIDSKAKSALAQLP